jgi:flagellar FliL protein
MSDSENTAEETPAKKSKLPVILGLLLGLVGAGGGFFAAWSGMILGGESTGTAQAKETPDAGSQIAFVPVEPLTISLGNTANAKHLRFRADLEVAAAHKDEVKKKLPRVVDVLNSYLRALTPADLEEQAALTRLRAQMLRRVQVVVGDGHVHDLLVMEFVLN